MFRLSLLGLYRLDTRLPHYLLLTLVAGLMLWSGSADLPLIDRDEPRFAEASREMLERSEWIIPYFNQDYRFDKPPMSYWLMSLSALLLGGYSEFAVRLPASVSAWWVGLMIYETGRRHLSAPIGLWAAMGWFASVQVLIHGRLAVADMPLIAAITASNWALWELLTRERPGRHWRVMLYLSLSFGFLAKGPLAWICPLLTVGLYRLMWRQPIPLHRLGMLWGIPLTVGLIGLWGIPALYLTDGLFWHQGMGKHVVERGMTPLNGRGFTPFYYLLSSFFSLFPAIAWVGGMPKSIRQHWTANTAFLLAWCLGPYLIFSFYATQLSHYVLPAFPAVLLLLAQTAMGHHQPDRQQNLVFNGVITGGWAAALLLLLIANEEYFPPEMTDLRHFIMALAGIFGGLSLLGFAACRRKVLLVVVSLCIVSTGLYQGSVRLRGLSPSMALTGLLSDLPESTEFQAVGFEEPSLVYYSHRHWSVGSLAEKNLDNAIAQPGTRVILLQRHETRLEAYMARYLTWIRTPAQKPESDRLKHWVDALEKAQSGYKVHHLSGINTARLSWVEMDVWIKHESASR
ncbi:MAG: ArnT family glycosyltransferase [Methylococcaceae bacterium]